jgi:putative transcription antitermination factor YqgF
MFTHLAIDWGEKQCGLAIGDHVTGLVIPLQSSFKQTHIFDHITAELAKRTSIHTFVVGVPTNFHGGKTDVSKHIEGFVNVLKTKFSEITVTSVNERTTTQIALSKLDKKHHKTQKDNQSAAEILTHYFAKSNKM